MLGVSGHLMVMGLWAVMQIDGRSIAAPLARESHIYFPDSCSYGGSSRASDSNIQNFYKVEVGLAIICQNRTNERS